MKKDSQILSGQDSKGSQDLNNDKGLKEKIASVFKTYDQQEIKTGSKMVKETRDV